MSASQPVALYARVSTDRQVDRDLSLSAQRKALVEHAKKKGWTVVKEYVDEGESARTTDRPQFQRMLAEAKHRQFTRLLVWKLDRFARNLRDLLNCTDELAKHGVTLESLNEPMEDSPVGRFSRNSLAGIGELFSSLLSQDVRRGMRESASRGNWVTSQVPLGYRKPPDSKKLDLDHETAPIITRIFDLYLRGYGIRKIADLFTTEGVLNQAWNQARILRILRNEVYTGTLAWNAGKRKDRPIHGTTIRVPHAFPAIIDEAAFARTQSFLHLRHKGTTPPRAIASRFLLTGFTVCARCGGSMVGLPARVWWGRQYHQFYYYVCRWRKHPTATRKCQSGMVAQHRAERAVITTLQQVFRDPDILKDTVARLEHITRERHASQRTATGGIDRQLHAAQSRLNKLYDALETGKFQVEDLAPRIAEWRKKVTELERQKAEQELGSPILPTIDVHALADAVLETIETLAEVPPEEMKQVLRSVIDTIRLDSEQAEIQWALPMPAVTVPLPRVHVGRKPRK